MDKLLIVVFDSAAQADKGAEALEELDAEGSITLYRQAVVSKDEYGKLIVHEGKPSKSQGSAGSAADLVSGNLGLAGELTGIKVVADYLAEAKSRLEAGKVAVVVEVDEETVAPADSRTGPLGGTVYRRELGDMLHEQIERDLATIKSQRETLDALYGKASDGASREYAKEQETVKEHEARVEAARAELGRIQDQARTRVEVAQREVDAKVAELRAQMAEGQPERRQELEQRVAQVRADHEARTRKLLQASQLARQALRPTRPDDGPTVGADAENLPPITRVYEGMTVVDAEGKWVGEVELVRMGDPAALTTKGQYRDAVTVDGRGYAEGEPDVPRGLREKLLRVGYIKVRRDGIVGIGKAKHYVRADEIAEVSGDRLVLSVPEAKLVDSRNELGPIIQ